MWRVAVLVAALALGGGAARAMEEASGMEALGIVTDHCVACHRAPPYNMTGRPDYLAAPAFDDMARYRDVYTPARLRRFLRKPHWPMERFILSERDIENLLAFIYGYAE